MGSRSTSLATRYGICFKSRCNSVSFLFSFLSVRPSVRLSSFCVYAVSECKYRTVGDFKYVLLPALVYRTAQKAAC